jgi:type I restriction enzyme S subunit
VSWPVVELSEVCSRVSVGHVGKTSEYYTDETGIPFLRTQNVSKTGLKMSDVLYVTHEFHEKLKKSQLFPGDVVLSRVISSQINCAVIPYGFGVANCANIILVRPDSTKLDSEFLNYYLKSEIAQRNLMKRQVGSAQSVVNTSVLKSWEIPLPPLDEQKRIAAILDKADVIRRKRQQAINLADDFLRSVFLDMFGDPMVNPMDWKVEPWGNVLKIINGKNQKAVLCPDGEYPIMGSGGEMGRANDYLSPENSIIIGRKGNINKPILVKEKYWNVDTAFGLVPDREKISYNYLYWFCVFFNFERLNKTVTIPSLTKADLLEVKIPTPCIEKQKLFDGIVNKLNSMKINYEFAESSGIDAFNSLSQKAFTGEL